jgi:PhoH-like ATPase
MKKNYVLDTNVLLHDPHAILKFEDNDLIIPIYVLEEIDNFKREATERGRNARTVTRLLDTQRALGSLSTGVKIGEGAPCACTCRSDARSWPSPSTPGSGDHAILQTAIEVRDQSPGVPTIFVTMDVNLRIRADGAGARHGGLREPVGGHRSPSTTGIVEVGITAAAFDQFFERVSPSPRRGSGSTPTSRCCCAMTARGRARRSAFPRRQGGHPGAEVPRDGVMGIRPRNKEHPSRSTSCSTTRCGWSRWSGRRGPARPCSPSRPGSSARPRTALTRACS